jgi:hypothetical protein
VRECFDAARSASRSRPELTLTFEPPRQLEPNSPVSFEVQLTDPLHLVYQVELYFRIPGRLVFAKLTAKAGPNVSIVIPQIASAVAWRRGVLVEEGTPDLPRRLKVLPGVIY